MDENKLARFTGLFGREGMSQPAGVAIAIAAVAGVAALYFFRRSKLAKEERDSRDYSDFEQRSGYERERLGQVLG